MDADSWVETAWDGWQGIEEWSSEDDHAEFVYGAYIDEPLVMDSTPEGAGTTRYYYHQNSLYSVCAMTNSWREIKAAYEYDPYGAHVLIVDGPDADAKVNFDSTDARSGPAMGTGAGGAVPIFGWHLGASPSAYTFTGRTYDPESGLIYSRNRYRDPLLSWLSRDPTGATEVVGVHAVASDKRIRIGAFEALLVGERLIEKEDGGRWAYHDGPNLYQYVRGSPLRYVDPSGLMSVEKWNKCCRDSGEANRQLDMLRGLAAKVQGEPYDWPKEIGCGFCAATIKGNMSSGPLFKIECWDWEHIKAYRASWPPKHQFVALKPKRDDTPTYSHPRNSASPIFDGWDLSSNTSKNRNGGIGECHFSESRVEDYLEAWPFGW